MQGPAHVPIVVGVILEGIPVVDRVGPVVEDQCPSIPVPFVIDVAQAQVHQLLPMVVMQLEIERPAHPVGACAVGFSLLQSSSVILRDRGIGALQAIAQSASEAAQASRLVESIAQLQTRQIDNQFKELPLKSAILNRMTHLGMPDSVRFTG
jgi:hypothetical protein